MDQENTKSKMLLRCCRKGIGEIIQMTHRFGLTTLRLASFSLLKSTFIVIGYYVYKIWIKMMFQIKLD